LPPLPGKESAMDLVSVDDTWQRLAALAAAVVLVSLLAHRMLRPIVLRLVRRSVILSTIAHRCDRPLQLALPLTALLMLWQGVPDDVRAIESVRHVSGVLAIIAYTWLAARSIRGIADGVIELHPSNVSDNLEARRIHTQTRVLSRVASGAALVTGLAFVLMTFPRARQFGASLLASAGVIGVVAGIAARSVFSNLLAGLQIAMAQPLRIDDVLIVEGEWGRVEEISSTYVVLALWDERRLIVPLQWFIDHPFQNWTRRSAQLLGSVMLWMDFEVPVDALRDEAKRLCAASPRWDRRVCVVQVTDANERAMQLRILVSSASSGQNFDLRCEVREGLIDFIRQHHPQALPRLRTEALAPAATASGRERPFCGAPPQA
jgi:small-conductance mechanosensitive channel